MAYIMALIVVAVLSIVVESIEYQLKGCEGSGAYYRKAWRCMALCYVLQYVLQVVEKLLNL